MNSAAVVTGAARGLDAAAARSPAVAGAHVVVTDILDDAGKHVAAEIGQAGGSAEYSHLEVTQKAMGRTRLLGRPE